MEQANAIIGKDPHTIIVDELVTDNSYGDFYISDIRISKTNRKHFDEDALNAFAENIKEMGVLQPIIIRPVTPTAEEPERFEIVAGERRYRACIISGIDTIPCRVRYLTDLQAAEIQILENLQRENPHEMEEAEGYQNLMLKYGYTADQIAEKVKQSRSYVYSRLKLCSLATGCRDNFMKRKFSASIALLISRIPVPELQVKAMSEILWPSNGTEPMSYRYAFQHIQQRYMLDLDKAIFPIKDSKLLAAVGSCITCPKRTGNEPIIYADVEPNICTDPDCFAEKIAANSAKLVTWANKSGVEIIEGDETDEGAKIVSCAKYNWEYEFACDATTLSRFDRMKTVQDNNLEIRLVIDNKLLPKPVKVARDKKGNVTALYLKSQVQTALEKAGVCYTEKEHQAILDAENNKPSSPEDAAAKSLKQKQDAAKLAEEEALELKVLGEQQYRIRVYKQLRQKAATGLNLASLKVLLKHALYLSDSDLYRDETINTALYGKQFETLDEFKAHIDNASTEEAQLMLIDILLGNALVTPGGWCREDFLNREDDDCLDTIIEMAQAEGIDPDQVQVESVAEESTHQETTTEVTEQETQVAPATKKRGRKSNAEKEALAAQEAASKPAPVEKWPFPTPKKESAES